MEMRIVVPDAACALAERPTLVVGVECSSWLAPGTGRLELVAVRRDSPRG
jgi:hypothetical protein